MSLFCFRPLQGQFYCFNFVSAQSVAPQPCVHFQMIRTPDSDQSRLKRFRAQGVKDHKAFEKYFVAETDTIG
jgi:hypothetical protein